MSRLSQASGLLAWGKGEEGQIDAIPKDKAEKIVKIIKEKMEEIKLSGQNNQSQSNDDPMNILKIRYAKGEISKKEFESMKKVLE